MKANGLNLTNILDTCLAQMAQGSTIDDVVKRYAAESPEIVEELRELLQIAETARPGQENLRVPAAAQRASRQKFLAQAQTLQQPGAARLRFGLRFLRFFQHNVGSIAFAVATIALLFVALGSLNALPGDGLYPVKLAAEQAGINLAGSSTAREERVSVFDSHRAEEVVAMIRTKRSGAVSFGGYLRSAKDRQWQVAGISLLLSETLDKQARDLNGAYVEIKGLLGDQGVVRVESLKPRLEPLNGTIVRIEPDGWMVDDRRVAITASTRMNGTPRVGSQVLVQAAPLADSARVLAISVEVTGETPDAATEPQKTPTATVTPTATPEPTVTGTPTITAKQPATVSPESEDDHKPSDDSPEKEEEDH